MQTDLILTDDLSQKTSRTKGNSSIDEADRHSPAWIAEQLRVRILNREIPAGEWLREKMLSDEFNVGRSIVRRVLRTLAEEGLVNLEENRGACVAAATPQEVFDLYEVRAALYGLATRFACRRAPNELVDEIVELIDRMIADHESGVPARDIIEESEVIFSLMASVASHDAKKMIEQVRRKTRWQYSWIAIEKMLKSPTPFDYWRIVREGLLERDVEKASKAARDIILYIQGEVSQHMLSQGMGFQSSVPAQTPAQSGKARADKKT